MRDDQIRELFDMVTGALERNTSALESVAKAVTSNEEKNATLAAGMNKMVGVITAAQRKIGGEIGPMIDRAKASHAALEHERREVADAGSTPARRGGSNAGP